MKTYPLRKSTLGYPGGGVKVFVLENKSNKDTPVEVVVVKPIIGEDGGEVLEMGNGEDLFLILPQQLVLPASSKRSVKVLYVGDPM